MSELEVDGLAVDIVNRQQQLSLSAFCDQTSFSKQSLLLNIFRSSHSLWRVPRFGGHLGRGERSAATDGTQHKPDPSPLSRYVHSCYLIDMDTLGVHEKCNTQTVCLVRLSRWS